LLLLLTLVFAGSLLSYHPEDRLFWNVTGSVGRAYNLFGTVGSHLAGILIDLLGFSSFWLPLTLLALAFMAFRGRTIASPFLNLTAILILLASFSALLSLQFPGEASFRGGALAAGGLVGIHLSVWIKGVLNQFGAYVFLTTLFIVSLMLVTDISLGRVFSRLGLLVLGFLRRINNVITKMRERKKRTRKTKAAHHRIASRPKVTIVDPKAKEDPPPQQERFPFMNVAGAFKLPDIDLLRDPPDQKNIHIQRETLEPGPRWLRT